METYHDYPAIAAFLVPVTFALLAAVIDFRRFRVPNALTFPLCAAGLVFHFFMGGLAGLQHSAGGILVGFLALVLFYLLAFMGAGDVKLMAAIGAWVGGTYALYVFCVAGLAAGVFSIVALACQHRLREIPAIFRVTYIQLLTLGRHIAGTDSASLGAAVQSPDRRRLVLPFAVMIAIGVLAVALGSWG